MKNNQEDKRVIINSREFDGSINRSWNCELISQEESSLAFSGVFDRDVSHPDLGEIRRGTISYEYYWLDRWYNFFCFHEPDGTFRNYYCNINMPPRFEHGVLDYVDLDIDVVMWPDGRVEILDEDEFDKNAKLYAYPNVVLKNAVEALATILELIVYQKLPHVHEIVQQKLR